MEENQERENQESKDIQDVQETENPGFGLEFDIDDFRSMPEEELRARLRRVAEGGNGDAAAHDKALGFLGSLVDRADSEDPQSLRVALAAAGALGYLKSTSSADRLAGIAGGPADSPGAKSLRKEARRALFQLKSWGIEPALQAQDEAAALVQAPPAGDKEKSRDRERMGKIIKAAATVIDCDGNRIVYAFIRPYPGRSVAADFLINETAGIVEGFLGPKSKRGFQREIDAGKGGGFPVIDIDPEYCLFAVQDAARRNEETQTRFPEAYALWKEAIGDRRSAYDRHPVYSELDAGAVFQDKSLLEGAAGLLDPRSSDSITMEKFKGVFASWGLEPEIAWKYSEKAEEALRGVIVVDPMTRNERVERILADAAEELFKNEGRRRFKYRFEEMAYMLLHVDDKYEYEAKCCLATALAIESGKRLLDIPFVYKLVSRSIGVFRRDEDEHEEDEADAKLIINPFE
ncbi:MAG: hypothetical protein HPY71_09310 [Firmicutes bacterium]|nr:hypothetical protein [Bacillota bacterium]